VYVESVYIIYLHQDIYPFAYISDSDCKILVLFFFPYPLCWKWDPKYDIQHKVGGDLGRYRKSFTDIVDPD
jgi:hypothetical protein